MLAATITEGAIQVQQHPDPEPGAGEVLVAVRAAGVNGADLLQMAGNYPPPPNVPKEIPGLEFAGEVLAAGRGVLRFAAGDRVMGLVGGGAQAEQVLVHERLLMPVPEGLDWAAAGALPEVFITAHDALFSQADLRPGERLLVHGAAGGVGTAAVQLGHAIGARVTATVRNPDHRQAVADLGAEVIAPEAFADAGPFDVILELVGAPNLAEDVRALSIGGRIAVIGIGAGASAELNLGVLMRKRARIHGSVLRARSLEERATAIRAVEREVLPLFESGALRVPVAETYPLADAAAAFTRFAAGRKLGKIVITNRAAITS